MAAASFPTSHPGNTTVLPGITLLAANHPDEHDTDREEIQALCVKMGLTASTPVTVGHVLRVISNGNSQWGTIGANSIANFPGVSVYHSANQSTTSGTPLAVAFNSERWDTDTCHDPATNNSRLVAKTAGKYLVTGVVRWASSAAGSRFLDIRVNGTTTQKQVSMDPVASTITSQEITDIVQLAVNDYIELMATQFSGGALNVENNGTNTPSFAMQWMSP